MDEDKPKLKAAENRLKKAVKILREKRINKQIEGVDTKKPDRMRKMLDEGKKDKSTEFFASNWKPKEDPNVRKQ